MARVALLGMAPLPFEAATRHHAPGVRSWQLARPLLRAGHRVRLYLCRYPEAYERERPSRERIACPEGDGAIDLMTPEAFEGEALDEALGEEPFDLVVGASARPSARAARAAKETPLWADLFGHTMAEGQAKTRFHGNDDLLLDYFMMEATVLLRADAFSAVSHAQGMAVVGELGLAGRLNALTEGHRFTTVIPCAAADVEPLPPGPPALRGTLLPAEAFIVLWCGGYNTWADVPTLVSGLERAMAAAPSLHFVSTGGELRGQDEETYERLRRAVGASTMRDRFHLLGWVDAATVTRCLAEADLGINVDRDIPESRLGSRNRIPTFLAHGVTVVSSRVSEVSCYVEEAGVGLTFTPGDAEELAVLLTDLASRPEAVRQRRAEVSRIALRDLSFETTAAPLVEFAARPSRAPDAGRVNALGSKLSGTIASLDAKDRLVEELRRRLADAEVHVGNLEALEREKNAAIAELRAFERRVKGSLPYRFYAALRGKLA